MKKCLIYTAVILLLASFMFSCKKNCTCKVTRSTSTTIDEATYEMGKMDEDACAQYQGSVTDGPGITRTFECSLN